MSQRRARRHQAHRFFPGHSGGFPGQLRLETLELRALMAGTLGLSWGGQVNLDLVNTTGAVGPDGIRDLLINLSGLNASRITSLKVDGPSAALRWGWGPGTDDRMLAEVVRQSSPGRNSDTAATAGLSLGVPSGLAAGQTLSVQVAYADGSSASGTVSLGAFSAGAAVTYPTSVPTVTAFGAVTWFEQYATDQPSDNPAANGHYAGDIHVGLSALPTGQSLATIVGADLSNQAGNRWSLTSPSNRSQWLILRSPATADRPSLKRAVDLYFPAVRNEAGSTLTLRLTFKDGSSVYTQFTGGASDPNLRDLKPNASASAIYVSPAGNDLVSYVDPITNRAATASLANLANTVDGQGRYDSIRLRAGTYTVTNTIHLNKAVSISADPGATVLFKFDASKTYQGGIAIHASHITLAGFSIRYANAVRFGKVDTLGGGYDPATITADNASPKVDITLKDLNIWGHVPVPDGSNQPGGNVGVDSGFLIRMGDNDSGQIVGNALRGGITDIRNGPWSIIDNQYVGAMAGTHAEAAFAAHYTHDLLVRGNVARLVHPVNADGSKGAVGPTYRFLVLDRRGFQTTVEGNSISGGIGELTTYDQGGGPPNAPEVILTESYLPHYEGKPRSISSDGRVLSIGTLRGEPASTGSVVSILDGPYAGTYRRIAQVIDANTYLMDDPLPQGSYNISIADGFTNSVYRSNTIDLRGTMSTGLVLTGNNWGTQVVSNTFVGGDRVLIDGNGNPISGQAIRIEATATEGPPEDPANFLYPPQWGWSRGAIFGLVMDGNAVVNSRSGITVSMTNWWQTRANVGRVYISGGVTRTRYSYDSAFLAANPNPQGMVVGSPGFWTRRNSDGTLTYGPSGGADPVGILLSVQGNWVNWPSGTGAASLSIVVGSATINAKETVNTSLSLATSAPGTSALDAIAVGQDGSDRAGFALVNGTSPGTYATSPPDGYQDLHIALVGLRTDVGLRSIDVYPYGYNHYEWNGTSVRKNLTMQVARGLGSSTADLFLQPDPGRPEKGTTEYVVVVTYADGSTAQASAWGVIADPFKPVVAGAAAPVIGDLTGDGKADVVAFRPTSSTFFVLTPSTNSTFLKAFGQANSDIPISADFDGDGRTDIAVFRPATAQWFYIRSSDGVGVPVALGQGGLDQPVPADYDGDGRTDLAVWRPTTGTWYIRGSSNGVPAVAFGQPGDIPVPGDYDGGNVAEPAVFRPSTGQLLILRADGSTAVRSFQTLGYTYQSGDVPVTTDFDGDGKADLVVYRRSSARWFIAPTAGEAERVVAFGQPGVDLPAALDYDGDGRSDFAVYRPTHASWLILRSSDGAYVRDFGQPGVDVAVATPDAVQPASVSMAAKTAAARAATQKASTLKAAGTIAPTITPAIPEASLATNLRKKR